MDSLPDVHVAAVAGSRPAQPTDSSWNLTHSFLVRSRSAHALDSPSITNETAGNFRSGSGIPRAVARAVFRSRSTATRAADTGSNRPFSVRISRVTGTWSRP